LKASNSEIDKTILTTGALLILIGIALGAFGAHGLKEKLSPESLSSFEVGIRYQLYHGLAFLIFGFNAFKLDFSFKLIFKLMLYGVILFSGSIYFFACKELFGIYHLPKVLYLITPIGGVLLLSAWGVLVRRFMKTD